MNKTSGNLNLIISTKTWNKDTDDLYDFEAKDVTTNEFRISKNDRCQFLISQNEKICLLSDFYEVKKKLLESGNPKILDGNFQIFNPFNSAKLKGIDKLYIDRLWLILKTDELCVVEEGDICKMGRVRLKIDKIVQKVNNYETNYNNPTIVNYTKTLASQALKNQGNLACNTNSFLNLNSIGNINPNYSHTNNCNELTNNNEKMLEKELKYTNNEEQGKGKDPMFICKICFLGDSDLTDPLITPCKCSGSVGYIHYKCLKQCVETKITTKSGENYICYLWKNFECEICLNQYPKFIKYKDLIYDIVEINITYDQYIIFDYTLYDDVKKKSFRKGIIVVRLEDESEITIGRTQNNTIKLKDISVSRNHCYFVKKNNKIYLSDRGSKFGTLLYLNKPFTLTSTINNLQKVSNSLIDTNANLISGKNFINFKLTQNWSFSNLFNFTFCCKCRDSNEDETVLDLKYLNDQNETTKTKDYLNDSYLDYVLNLETIIKNEDSPRHSNKSFI